MKKKFLVLLLSILPEICFADRYGVYDDSGGGGTGIFDILVVIACVIFSFVFLACSYEEWRKRRESGEKVNRSGFSNVIAILIGYSLIALFLSVPFLYAIKLYGGVAAVKDYWLPVGIVCFGVVAFLRQT